MRALFLSFFISFSAYPCGVPQADWSTFDKFKTYVEKFIPKYPLIVQARTNICKSGFCELKINNVFKGDKKLRKVKYANGGIKYNNNEIAFHSCHQSLIENKEYILFLKPIKDTDFFEASSSLLLNIHSEESKVHYQRLRKILSSSSI